VPMASAPIRIGYCLSLTGPLADSSQSTRLARDIWREDVNSRGGLLGHGVELVCYDDRAAASLVPGINWRNLCAALRLPAFTRAQGQSTPARGAPELFVPRVPTPWGHAFCARVR